MNSCCVLERVVPEIVIAPAAAPKTFRHVRGEIAKELRAAVREVNRILAVALEAGVRVEMDVDGHPRFNVGICGASCVDDCSEMATVAWAVRIKATTAPEKYPRGGTPFGTVAYCDWQP